MHCSRSASSDTLQQDSQTLLSTAFMLVLFADHRPVQCGMVSRGPKMPDVTTHELLSYLSWSSADKNYQFFNKYVIADMLQIPSGLFMPKISKIGRHLTEFS